MNNLRIPYFLELIIRTPIDDTSYEDTSIGCFDDFKLLLIELTNYMFTHIDKPDFAYIIRLHKAEGFMSVI